MLPLVPFRFPKPPSGSNTGSSTRLQSYTVRLKDVNGRGTNFVSSYGRFEKSEPTLFPYLTCLHNSTFDVRVFDEDEDGLINFREFARGLGIICKGELQDRMQFMYRMHVPPAVCKEAAHLSDEKSLDSGTEPTESGSVEVLVSQSRDQCSSDRLSAEEALVSILPKIRKEMRGEQTKAMSRWSRKFQQ